MLSDSADQEGAEVGAIVLAQSEDICEEALRRLEIEWEVLPFVVDVRKGRAPDAPVIRPASSGGGRGGGMMGGGMMGGTDLEALEAASDFDREFIEQMIPHHQMGVMMARMVDVRSDRPEIDGLAAAIIKTQSAEIDQMRDWYRAWYE
jgi:CO/xanthine dehydrogenase Mo-binding subunit